MAIKATVSFKTIQATVSHRKLSLDASLVPELGNQISFSKLTAVANWKNLYLHDVHVNAERTIYTFNDQYSLADSAVFAVDKGINDTLGFLSPDPVFTVGKVLSDNINFADFARTQAGKNVLDPYSLTESHAVTVGKASVDSFAFSENVHTLLTFIRSFNNPVVMAESISSHAGKALSNNYNFADQISTHPNKGAFDAQSFTESQTFVVGKGISEPAILLDQLTITRQPNNFVFNQVGSAVTVTGEPSDTVTFSDAAPAFVINTALQDYYTLDDFAQIDKDVEGVKTNVVGMSDSLAFDHIVTHALLNRTLVGNMVLNAG